MPRSNIFATLVLSTMFWGANFPLAQRVVMDLHPLAAAAGRFAIAAAALVAVLWLRGQRVPALRLAGSLGLLGVFGIAGFNILFFLAMQRTSAVNGALIMGTNPLVTALLAALVLGERMSVRQMAALPVALVGVGAVVLGGGAGGGGVSVSAGDGLMLAADLVWAGYNVGVRRLMPPGDGMVSTAVMLVWSAVALIAVAVIVDVPLAVPGPIAGLCLLAVALPGTVLAYLMYNAGLKALGAGVGALFMNLVPVWAMVTAALMGRPPNVAQMIGAAAVIGAVSFAMIPARRGAAQPVEVQAAR